MNADSLLPKEKHIFIVSVMHNLTLNTLHICTFMNIWPILVCYTFEYTTTEEDVEHTCHFHNFPHVTLWSFHHAMLQIPSKVLLINMTLPQKTSSSTGFRALTNRRAKLRWRTSFHFLVFYTNEIIIIFICFKSKY